MPKDPEDPEQRTSTLLLECWVEDASTHCLTRQFHFESDEGYKQFVINILFIPHQTNLRLSITENVVNRDIGVAICRKTIAMEDGILDLMASVEAAFQKAVHSHEFTTNHPIWSWLQGICKSRRRSI